jgi:hypothetical protein
MKQIAHIFNAHLIGKMAINRKQLSFSVSSVSSVVTTSHSTKLPKDTSQVAGYVAKCFL